jgi:hypothetical protein
MSLTESKYGNIVFISYTGLIWYQDHVGLFLSVSYGRAHLRVTGLGLLSVPCRGFTIRLKWRDMPYESMHLESVCPNTQHASPDKLRDAEMILLDSLY